MASRKKPAPPPPAPAGTTTAPATTAPTGTGHNEEVVTRTVRVGSESHTLSGTAAEVAQAEAERRKPTTSAPKLAGE